MLRPALVALASLLAAKTSTAQFFSDATAAAGLSGFPLDDGQFGSGMCAADFDADGDLDLVIPENAGRPIRYLRNDGRLRFTDLTDHAGLGLARSVRACRAADIGQRRRSRLAHRQPPRSLSVVHQ